MPAIWQQCNKKYEEEENLALILQAGQNLYTQ